MGEYMGFYLNKVKIIFKEKDQSYTKRKMRRFLILFLIFGLSCLAQGKSIEDDSIFGDGYGDEDEFGYGYGKEYPPLDEDDYETFGKDKPPPGEKVPPMGERPPPGMDMGQSFVYLPEGQLICVKRKPLGELSETRAADDDAMRREDFEAEFEKPKSAVAIGCCPRGDPNGKVFRDGTSCCVDEIFNTTTHMCCSQKKRVLESSKVSLQYCYGKSCRVEDLNVDPPMEHSCTFDKLASPSKCVFSCPAGSQLRGSKVTKCVDGAWTTNPECCEGCPAVEKYDITFVVDLNEDSGIGGQADVRSLIRGMISYTPISKDGVRVAVTSFNNAVLKDDRTWDLTDYTSHEELNNAINLLQDDTVGAKRYGGTALKHVSGHAFRAVAGNRNHVDDVIVYIATGKSDDSVEGFVQELAQKTTLILMYVGPDTDAAALETLPAAHKIRVSSFGHLDAHKKYLYHSLCGSHCLTSS